MLQCQYFQQFEKDEDDNRFLMLAKFALNLFERKSSQQDFNIILEEYRKANLVEGLLFIGYSFVEAFINNYSSDELNSIIIEFRNEIMKVGVPLWQKVFSWKPEE